MSPKEANRQIFFSLSYKIWHKLQNRRGSFYFMFPVNYLPNIHLEIRSMQLEMIPIYLFVYIILPGLEDILVRDSKYRIIKVVLLYKLIHDMWDIKL